MNMYVWSYTAQNPSNSLVRSLSLSFSPSLYLRWGEGDVDNLGDSPFFDKPALGIEQFYSL